MEAIIYHFHFGDVPQEYRLKPGTSHSGNMESGKIFPATNECKRPCFFCLLPASYCLLPTEKKQQIIDIGSRRAGHQAVPQMAEEGVGIIVRQEFCRIQP